MVQLARSIDTERLVLRPFAISDLDELALIFNDESVNRYLYSLPRDRAKTLESLEKRVAMPREVGSDNVVNIAVELRESGRLIGDFMLRWRDDEHHQGEMGGSLHPDYHGLGYAPEIYRAVLELAFDDFDLHRVFAQCDGRNSASIRSLEKAGLHQEAHLVENEYVKGEWTDEIVLAILQREWREDRNSL